MRLKLRVSVLAILVIVMSTPMQVVGCELCRYSPSGFGFCRFDPYDGFVTCEEYVSDSFTGRTDCHEGNYCPAPGPGSSGGCYWWDYDCLFNRY